MFQKLWNMMGFRSGVCRKAEKPDQIMLCPACGKESPMRAGNLAEKPAALRSCVMSGESIAGYLRWETERGASENSLRSYRRITGAVYDWLPEDKILTRERLLAWRQSLKDHGYSPETQQHYVKGINRYLDCMGWPELRFNRGRARDIAGRQFGYLTAIEPTGQKERRDRIWRCVCRCGREAEYPATRLLTGNVMSCGCLRGEQFKKVNKYIGGTSIRQSMQEQVHSTRAVSGYTGVTPKGGKWKAYIKYKGQEISLGCYTRLEDAVKARARGKELVRQDAEELLGVYEQIHRDDPPLPDRAEIRRPSQKAETEKSEASAPPPVRSDNTSGFPGVCRKRSKWAAKITFQKVTYQLGVFDNIEDAAAARQRAERRLQEDPAGFPDWVSQRRDRREAEQAHGCAI